MNNIVIYESRSGFTKKYALWIKEALGCEAMALKDWDFRDVEGTIIYGGCIRVGEVKGLKKMMKVYSPQQLIVFATGLSDPDNKEAIDKIKEFNHIEGPFYYYQGGIDYNKTNVFNKLLFKMLRYHAKKKMDIDPFEKSMYEALSMSNDYTNKEDIKELVESVR